MKADKQLIVIAGPTAVGKSSLALKIAQKIQCPILSADSRQCFQELNIGTSKPSSQELELIPHFFINTHSIEDEMSVRVFLQYALEKLNSLFEQHSKVLLVGGTGLYIKALLHGLDVIPEVPDLISKQVQALYDEKGIEALQKELSQQDPKFLDQKDHENPHRLIRALSFVRAHGKSILDFQTDSRADRIFEAREYCLRSDRDKLYQKINERVDKMVGDGLEEEVRSLERYWQSKNFKTVGYQEWLPYFNKKSTREDSIAKIKQSTRNYAKRQMTWFRNQGNFQFLEPEKAESSILANF